MHRRSVFSADEVHKKHRKTADGVAIYSSEEYTLGHFGEPMTYPKVMG
jgi:hypothetical protein